MLKPEKRKTFKEVCEELERTHAQRLMTKARLFNNLAKMSKHPNQHHLAYEWKNLCLQQLLEKCKNLTYSSLDYKAEDKGLMLIGVKGMPGSLHTHSRWLTGAA